MQYVPTQRARDGYPHAGPADGGCYETKKGPAQLRRAPETLRTGAHTMKA